MTINKSYSLILALLIVLLGSRVPLPGFDTAALASSTYLFDSSWTARYSVFALGMMPVAIVLAYAELVKLLIPSLAKWQQASAVNASRMRWMIHLLVLVITATQGYSVWLALGAMGLVDGATVPLLIGILSLMAASAVLMWLMGVIRFPESGNGFWWLVAIFALYNFSESWSSLVELWHSKTIPVWLWALLGLMLILGFGLLVAIRKILGRQLGFDHPDSTMAWAILLWPPFLASIFARHLIGLFTGLLPGFQMVLADHPWLWDAIPLTFTLLLIPLFAYAYLKQALKTPQTLKSNKPVCQAFLKVIGVQLVISLGFFLLNPFLYISVFDGATFMVMAMAVLALCSGLGKRPKEA